MLTMRRNALARDCALLRGTGYGLATRLQGVKLFDLFRAWRIEPDRINGVG